MIVSYMAFPPGCEDRGSSWGSDPRTITHLTIAQTRTLHTQMTNNPAPLKDAFKSITCEKANGNAPPGINCL